MTESVFEGEMIRLRPFEPADIPALGAYLNHPTLAGRRYLPWRFPEREPLSHKQVEGVYQKWIEEEEGLRLAVVHRESGDLLGHARCDWEWDPHCPDVAVVTAPTQQRQGYGSEALGLLLRYLFENTVAHNVACWIDDWNEPGLRFAARHGFQQNGRMRRAGVRQGRYYDVIIADMLRPEWLARGEGGNDAAGR